MYQVGTLEKEKLNLRTMVGCLNRTHPQGDFLVSPCEGNQWEIQGILHHPCCDRDQQLTQGLSPQKWEAT